MSWALWSAFAILDTGLCLTPGPAVLYVVGTALQRGSRQSVFSTLGILAGNAIYFALSATGVGALLVASYELFSLVKWLGAAYLVFLGIKALLSRSAEITPQAVKPGSRLFSDGLVLQLANPKAIVFFVAILPSFLDPSAPIGTQLAILGATSIAIEVLVLTAYGFAAGRAFAAVREPRHGVWMNRISGALLIGAGGGLALLRRD